MYVRFWGTRGSIATPGLQTSLYGGNTSCVEVRADDGTRIMLDCGTGARQLGLHLLRTEVRPFRLHLLISHTHWDHIQGFPFFDPAFLPDSELHLYAPWDFQQNLEEALAGQMQYTYFPVKLADLRSRMHYTAVTEGSFWVGNVRVDTQYLNHTASTLAYRLCSGGTTIVYVTDHEPFWPPSENPMQHPGDGRHIEFLRGADLIIHDAQYTMEEYRGKVGWGHSPIEYAVDVALAAGAARLALFHHDPGHDDTITKQLEHLACDRVTARRGALEVFAAAEGLAWQIHGKSRTPTRVEASAWPPGSIAGARVMIVSGDELQAAAIARVLGEDDLVLTRTPDRHTALELASTTSPDLVLINQQLLDGDGASFIQSLRARLRQSDVPVMLLTDGTADTVPVGDRLTAATDYLAPPISLSMLRARVRTWLVRTLLGLHRCAHWQAPRARRAQS